MASWNSKVKLISLTRGTVTGYKSDQQLQNPKTHLPKRQLNRLKIKIQYSSWIISLTKSITLLGQLQELGMPSFA